MSPAPPGSWELRAHPAARGRRARPSLAPGRRPQPRSAFTASPAAAERGTACPALPVPHAAVTRPGERLLDTEPRPEDAGSPQPPHLDRSPRAPRRRLWPVRQPRRSGRARAGPALSPGSEAAGAGTGAQMTGRSSQRGGGRLRVFVLGEEAESPITQFVYSTQTQFVTGWLCWGVGEEVFSHCQTSEPSQEAVTYMQRGPADVTICTRMHVIHTEPSFPPEWTRPQRRR